MPVISSKVLVAGPQIDGRRWMTETHVFADGTVAEVSTLITKDADPEAMSAERAKALDEAEANHPEPDPVAVTLDAMRAAYDSGDLEATQQGLTDAAELVSVKVDAAAKLEAVNVKMVKANA